MSDGKDVNDIVCFCVACVSAFMWGNLLVRQVRRVRFFFVFQACKLHWNGYVNVSPCCRRTCSIGCSAHWNSYAEVTCR